MTRAHRARRGFNLVGLIAVVLLLAAIGLSLSSHAQQANRTGYWFLHSQVAQGLADSGVKQAAALLARANSAAAIQREPAAKQAVLTQILDALAGRGTASVTVPLFSSTANDLPPALASEVQSNAVYSPKVEVRIVTLPPQPLWNGLLDGIPLIPGESKGGIIVIATASVKAPVGPRIERTMALEKGFKVISVLPPLLGRFALFVGSRGTEEANAVPMSFDPNTGDAALVAGAPAPLVVRGETALPVVATAPALAVDRAAFVSQLPADLLDRQGWIYLGGSPTERWMLRLAHGYGHAGEAPLLPMILEARAFGDAPGPDAAFRQRFDQESYQARGVHADFSQADTGLWGFEHGFASNAGEIGVELDIQDRVRGVPPPAILDLAPTETASVRLFGGADALSPTVVFGPVYRSVLHRSELAVDFSVGLGGPSALQNFICFPFFAPRDYPGTERAMMDRIFANDFPKWAAGPRDDQPYALGLNIALGTAGSGPVNPKGLVDAATSASAPTASPPAAPSGPTFRSRHLPWLGAIPDATPLPQAARDKLINGDCDAAEVFVGPLATGLTAFTKALDAKATFEMTRTGAAAMLAATPLRVPGVVVVPGPEPLVLSAIAQVAEGGIIVCEGPIRITADIVRGSTEPLTLVSLKGDVEVEAGVQKVEAALVSITGKVILRATGVTVNGAIACHHLDLGTLRGVPGARTLHHSRDVDPTGPQRLNLRVFYGGDSKLSLSGGSGS